MKVNDVLVDVFDPLFDSPYFDANRGSNNEDLISSVDAEELAKGIGDCQSSPPRKGDFAVSGR